MTAIKPDLHGSESSEKQSLRMQGCKKEWQPHNNDIATRQRPMRGDFVSHALCAAVGFPRRGIVQGPLPLPCTCLVPDRPQKRVTLH